MGKPIEQALGEVDFAPRSTSTTPTTPPTLLADEPIELLEGEGSAFVRRSLGGLLLGIMPWNYPYYQVARFAGPNLVVGNTILLKHAPQCPESRPRWSRSSTTPGSRPDAYINIYATNDQIAEVIADPRVQGVSLTGSGRAGAAVAEVAGRHLKKVVLELGGSDPFIVLPLDDLDAVVEAAVGGRLENGGQACNAAKRFIVVDELYDAFLDKFTAKLTEVEPGDPTSSDTTIGPLSSATAADRLEDQVQARDWTGRDARRRRRTGRQLLQDDRPDRHHTGQPRLHRGVLRARRAGLQGRFRGRGGRVSPTTPPSAWAPTSSPTDHEQALRVADQIEAGMVFINAVGAEGVELPFGGVKASGFGRELGRFGADEFVNKKLIRVGG